MKKSLNMGLTNKISSEDSEERENTEKLFCMANQVYYKYLKEIKDDPESDDYCTAFMTF